MAIARKPGLLEARTERVAFLDQDDLWLPSRVERLMAVFDAHPDLQVLVTGERVFEFGATRDAARASWQWSPKPHMLDPRSMVEGLHDHLNPGGIVFAAIPHVQLAFNITDLLQGRWESTDTGLLDQTHLPSSPGRPRSVSSPTGSLWT